MKAYLKIAALVWLLSTINHQLSTVFAQGTAFTYQGRLNNTGAPANGSYDFTFKLFGLNSGGPAIVGPVTNAATPVTNGLFITAIDFGPAFTGASNWLEIAVRTNGSGVFITLAPRQQLTPVPYAISAESVSGGISAAQLTSGVVPTNVIAGFQGPFFSSVNGGLGNVAFGQYDVVDGGQNNNVQSAYGFVGGGLGNSAGAGGYFATVGGGEDNNASGMAATVPGGYLNTASGAFSFAAGDMAQATNQGAFVWSDASGGVFHSARDNSFNVRATGGAYFATSGAGMMLEGAPVLTISSAALGITLQQNTNGAQNVIEGSPGNYISRGIFGSVISGGGITNDQGFAFTNIIAGNFCVIGGGVGNAILGDINGFGSSTIGGGNGNFILPNANDSTIGGGAFNSVYNDVYDYGASVIGGGNNNVILTNSPFSMIGGGNENVIYGDNGDEGASVISGGNNNVIYGNSPFSSISGGYFNEISGDSTDTGGSVVAGGINNVIRPGCYGGTISGGAENGLGGSYATVAGGEYNEADGFASFAAGYGAKAVQDGTFVWADYENTPFESTAQDQFLVRAQGGMGLGTASPAAQLHVSSATGGGFPQLRLDQTANNDYSRLRMTSGSSGGIWDIAVGGGSPNVMNFFTAPNLTSSGTNIFVLKPSGNAVLWGTLAQGSDRAHKENIRPLDSQTVLAKLAGLPITEWNYITEQGVDHVGPMAQDFYAAFKLGEDDKHITTVDEGGVALAAIKALNQELNEQKTENAELKERLASLEARVNQMTH